MTNRRTVVVRSLVAAAMACLTVSAHAEVLPFLFPAWFYLVVRHARRGVAAWAVPAAIVGAIVLAAYHAPFKPIDGRMIVPKPVMTVAELRERRSPPCRFLVVDRGDFVDYDDFEQAQAAFDDLTVQFPSADMTMREFIRAVERQTPFRHDFRGAACGNAYSILFGQPGFPRFRAPAPR